MTPINFVYLCLAMNIAVTVVYFITVYFFFKDTTELMKNMLQRGMKTEARLIFIYSTAIQLILFYLFTNSWTAWFLSLMEVTS